MALGLVMKEDCVAAKTDTLFSESWRVREIFISGSDVLKEQIALMLPISGEQKYRIKHLLCINISWRINSRIWEVGTVLGTEQGLMLARTHSTTEPYPQPQNSFV